MSRAHATGCPPGALSQRRGDLGQHVLRIAARVTGILAATMIAGRIVFRTRAGRAARVRPGPTRSREPEFLQLLAHAIVGCHKGMIEGLFGRPRTAAIDSVGLVVNPGTWFRQSNIWYYPLPRQGVMAMAIRFTNDTATQVEFFTSPRLGE